MHPSAISEKPNESGNEVDVIVRSRAGERGENWMFQSIAILVLTCMIFDL